jgi:hypothetical protein
VSENDQSSLALRLLHDGGEGFEREEGVSLFVGVVIDEADARVDDAETLVADALELLSIEAVPDCPFVVP